MEYQPIGEELSALLNLLRCNCAGGEFSDTFAYKRKPICWGSYRDRENMMVAYGLVRDRR